MNNQYLGPQLHEALEISAVFFMVLFLVFSIPLSINLFRSLIRKRGGL